MSKIIFLPFLAAHFCCCRIFHQRPPLIFYAQPALHPLTGCCWPGWDMQRHTFPNCILFERMLAAFGLSGKCGFLMYLADSFGYLGSILVLFGKDFLNWTCTGGILFAGRNRYCRYWALLAPVYRPCIFIGKYKKSATVWEQRFIVIGAGIACHGEDPWR